MRYELPIICGILIFYIGVPCAVYALKRYARTKLYERISGSRFFPLYPEHFNKNIDGELSFAFPEREKPIRFFGKIKGWSAVSTLVSSNNGVQILADLQRGDLFTLAPVGAQKKRAQYKLERVSWQNIRAITVNSNVFIVGAAEKISDASGKPIIRIASSARTRLTAIIYEGDKLQFLPRVISALSVEQNWISPASALSFTCGFLFLAAILVAVLNEGASAAYCAQAFTAAFGVATPFLPPGLACVLASVFLRKKNNEYRFSGAFFRALRNGIPESEQTAITPSGALFEIYPATREECANIPSVQIPKDVLNSLEQEYYICGCKDAEKNSSDPFFQSFSMPARPEKIAQACLKKAFKGELLSLAFAALGIIINAYIMREILEYALRGLL